MNDEEFAKLMLKFNNIYSNENHYYPKCNLRNCLIMSIFWEKYKHKERKNKLIKSLLNI